MVVKGNSRFFMGVPPTCRRPDQTAVLRVVGLEAAARAAIAAGKADENHALDIERRCRDREILLPALGLDRPCDLACRSIERNELTIGSQVTFRANSLHLGELGSASFWSEAVKSACQAALLFITLRDPCVYVFPDLAPPNE